MNYTDKQIENEKIVLSLKLLTVQTKLFLKVYSYFILFKWATIQNMMTLLPEKNVTYKTYTTS